MKECNRSFSIEPWREAIRELNCRCMQGHISESKYLQERHLLFAKLARQEPKPGTGSAAKPRALAGSSPKGEG